MILAAACGLGACLLIEDHRTAARPVTELRRNTYGGGNATRSLRVILDGVEQEGTLNVTVSERRYTREEMDRVFRKSLDRLEELILGDNKSLDRVQTDLNLITEIPDEPVEVSWELDRYDLINVYGELDQEKLAGEPEGVLVTLKACLTYTEDRQMQILQEMTARLEPGGTSGAGDGLAAASAAVKAEEEKNRESTKVKLPTATGGRTLEFREVKNPRGWYVLALGPVLCLLLAALERQRLREEKEAREHQMLLDYPEIVNKLTLLLGAGMTVKGAWEKIVRDYERQKEIRGRRFAYEEMETAFREMQSGITEASGYERFGKRCGLKAYRKLAALLSQNLRKGARGLSELLGAEADQAFEERRAAAMRRGEEAGTKLLAPMFLMLAMVLIVVIVPAFLSIQM